MRRLTYFHIGHHGAAIMSRAVQPFVTIITAPNALSLHHFITDGGRRTGQACRVPDTMAVPARFSADAG